MVFPSINDFFRGKTAQAASPSAVAAGVQVEKPQALQQPGANPANIANLPEGQSANGPAKPTEQNINISPLDAHKDIWQTPTPKDGQQPVDPFSQPLLSSDPATLAAAARKMNFTQGLDPAVATKALQGDQQSLLALINQASQNAFIAASQLTTQVAEGAISTNNKRVDSVLEDKFKKFVLDQTRSENPVLNHPAAQPMLDLAKKQLMQKHPEKSASEIHRMAEGFLSDFASTLTSGNTAAATKSAGQANDPTDFSSWG